MSNYVVLYQVRVYTVQSSRSSMSVVALNVELPLGSIDASFVLTVIVTVQFIIIWKLLTCVWADRQVTTNIVVPGHGGAAGRVEKRVQSPTTYTLGATHPRFKPLPEHAWGAW